MPSPESSSIRRRGAVPAWVPLAVLVLGAVWLAREIQARTESAGFERIELARSRIDSAPPWIDPRWRERIGVELARFGDTHPSDRARIDAAARAIGELPFVKRVDAPRVLWPGGLEIDVEFARPVACVRAGDHFYPVDADGRVLDGGWSSPPWVDSGFLPLLVDDPDAWPFAPGDELDNLHLVDALDVAVSMWEHLSSEYRTRLGRIAIDARAGRSPDPAQPGTLLLLENQRAVLFGRPPGRLAFGASHSPGDLPIERRWHHVASALERLATGDPADDWVHLDARFDTPALQPRLPPGVRPETIGGGHATRKGGADGGAARAAVIGGAATPGAPAGRSGVR